MKTVELTELESQKVNAFIRSAIYDWEVEYVKSREGGGEDYELKARIEYYRNLAKKFEVR